MFSVPGWNVSAPLAVQVEKPKVKEPNTKEKKSKKRKRQQDELVNEANVGELWDKVAAAPPKEDTAAGEGTQGEEKDTAQPAEAPRKKPRKRSKKKKVEVEGDAPVESNLDTAAAEEKGDSGAKEDITAGSEAAIVDAEKDTALEDADAQPPTTSDSITKPDAATIARARADKKRRKEENRAAKALLIPSEAPAPATKLTPAVSLIPEPPGLTPMQRSMRTKLASARFRHLNESLYTKPSKESLEIFKETPSMFEDYHRGFAQQVEVWPSNPVDGYVSDIVKRGKVSTRDPWKDKKRALKKKGGNKSELAEVEVETAVFDGRIKPLPRNIKGHCTIADLGCGTASLSYSLQQHLKPLQLTVHSFDLARPTGPSGPLVTVADICALPLPDNAVDVAIFCLALMGTNWLEFIDEAFRILRWKGELWISEIKSRFGRVGGKSAPGKPPPNSVGLNKKPDKKTKPKRDAGIAEGAQDSDDETELAVKIDGREEKEGTDVTAFVEVLRKHGFVLDALPEKAMDAVDLSNKMFVNMRFTKSAPPTHGKNKKEVVEKPGFGTGKPDQRGIHGMKSKKYQAAKEEEGEDKVNEKDAKVLKPCLYKIR
jgi:ribosomal RNA-processing protein 8